MTETLWTVDTGYANAGVIVEDGVVVDAAPIFAWMIGKRWERCRRWRKVKWVHKHD